METGALIDALRVEGELMGTAIAAAHPDDPVPTCPDWSVRDLVHHVGEVHRWATAIVRDALLKPADGVEARGALPSDDALVRWFRDGHRALVDALAAAPDDLECWAFLPAPSPRAFWARRQAHETGIHRVDAEAAVGPLTPFAADVAVDGIDELLDGFGARSRSRLRADPAVSLGLHATDVGRDWTMQIEPDRLVVTRTAEPAMCDVTADASMLFMFAWNRVPQGRLRVDGDDRVLDVWRDGLQIRWS